MSKSANFFLADGKSQQKTQCVTFYENVIKIYQEKLENCLVCWPFYYEESIQNFTQHNQLHPITQSLFLLLPLNAKAPYLHSVSVFYHRELNSLREMAKLSYIQSFLALLIVHHTEDEVIVQMR